MKGTAHWKAVIIGIFIWDVMYRKIEDLMGLIDEVTIEITIERNKEIPFLCRLCDFKISFRG